MPRFPWLKKVGDFALTFASDVTGSMLGQTFLDRTKVIETAGHHLAETIGPLIAPADREDIMKALLNILGTSNPILDLLTEANSNGGFIKVGTRRYTENWIVGMLLKVETRDRQWVFAVLSNLCTDREKFFAALNILHNDGLVQMYHVIKDRLIEIVGAGGTNAYLTRKANELRNSPWRRKLRERAERQRRGFFGRFRRP